MIVPRIVWAMFVPISLYAIFATVTQAINSTAGKTYGLGELAGWVVVLGLLLFVWGNGKRLVNSVESFSNAILAVLPKRFLFICLLVGLTIRIVWVLLFPAEFTSDFKSYWQLANRLADQGNYYIANTYAYWPPGLPLFLLPSLLVLGSQSWIPLLNNLALFSGTLMVVYLLAATVSDHSVARVASILLALWPNFIFYSGLPGKELLLALLLPLAILFYLHFDDPLSGERKRASFVFLAGLVLGYASLTQASVILFPIVLGVYEIIRQTYFRTILSKLTVLGCGMVLVISPWTVRNYLVLDAFVPVSTNGGWSLYVGNNPKATGGYLPLEGDFQGYDEVTVNKRAFVLGRKWILDNPTSFMALSVKKQMLFLGDDSDGVFWTLKRGLRIDDIRYAALKGLSNLFWIGIFIMSLFSLIFKWKSRLSNSPEVSVLIFSVLYFFIIHSVFESGSRHHTAVIGFLSILAALAVYRSAPGRLDDHQAGRKPQQYRQ